MFLTPTPYQGLPSGLIILVVSVWGFRAVETGQMLEEVVVAVQRSVASVLGVKVGKVVAAALLQR